jgi:hypothetical protein
MALARVNDRVLCWQQSGKGTAMWWLVGLVTAVALAVGAWLLMPAIRTIFRPGFEPTSKDELGVYRAQSSGDSHGAGQ